MRARLPQRLFVYTAILVAAAAGLSVAFWDDLQPVVDPVGYWAPRLNDPTERLGAIGALGECAWRSAAARAALVRAAVDREGLGGGEQAASHLAQLGRQIVPEMVRLLDSGDHRSRCTAALVLELVGPAAAGAVPSLLPMLEGPLEPPRPFSSSEEFARQVSAVSALFAMEADGLAAVRALAGDARLSSLAVRAEAALCRRTRRYLSCGLSASLGSNILGCRTPIPADLKHTPYPTLDARLARLQKFLAEEKGLGFRTACPRAGGRPGDITVRRDDAPGRGWTLACRSHGTLDEGPQW